MSDASPSTDKRRKHSLLLMLKNIGIFAAARAYAANGLRILCYHGVWRGAEGFGDSMFISRATFERRLDLVRALGFEVVPLEQAVLALRRQAAMPRDAVAITIDDGWYSSFADMLPALIRHRMHATIYCDTRHLEAGQPVPHVMARYLRQIHCRESALPPAAAEFFRQATDLRADQATRYHAMLQFAACLNIDVSHYLDRRAFNYMSEEETAEAAALGFSIELHTHTHSLGQFTFPEVAQEIALNRGVLGRILHQPPEHFRHFCYPGGRVAPGVRSALAHLGISSATTLEPGIAYQGDDPLMLPRIVDGDHLSDLEFEAELCGVGSFLRRTRATADRWLSHPPRSETRIDHRINA